ncbi:Hypothetical predicted protein [Paramuricea clavata]|uniref:DUF5641 domain-containing protein n=1 Tax=Paramuricea clavata TaxID=317549 RepID=A0A6S7JGG4_PARCT|nr:Hypothetical predicted protein [Paramuricea clavata]
MQKRTGRTFPWESVDDGLPSTNSQQEAIEIRKQMTELLRREGFYLHKWLTNDPEVLATIPSEERSLKLLELTGGKLPTDRALGLIWDAEEDTLKFTGPAGTPGKTKRQILSQSFSIWDPRGLVLPFSFRAKMLLQKLHRKKIEWDDEINDDEPKEWFSWCKEVKELSNIAIPRVLMVVHELETKLGADTVSWRYIPTDVNPADDISRGSSPNKEINSRKVWIQSQALANFFWKRFITEYIPNQTRRKKWTEKARSMKVGDLVLVADSNQSRGMWPMGRITVVYPRADKVVRVVVVKTPQGEYKRSVYMISLLCLLEEVNSDDGCLGCSSTGGGDVPASGD